MRATSTISACSPPGWSGSRKSMSALNILPKHYHFVAEALLGAIKDVLGEAATPEILEAWGEAYWFLADLLIAREASHLQPAGRRPGRLERLARLRGREHEAGKRGHPLLRPGSGRRRRGHAPPPRPVPHLRARPVPDAGRLKRNYSISSAPDSRAYRISVKREARPGAPPGLVSAGSTTGPAPARAEGGAAGRRVLPGREG